MAAGVARTWNGYFDWLGRVAGAAQRHQEYVLVASTLVMSLSIVYQKQIDAAGFSWWSTSKYTWFTLALALAVIGAGPFARGQGGGGAMRTSPSRA